MFFDGIWTAAVADQDRTTNYIHIMSMFVFQVLDTAILVRTTSDAREAGMMLKTLFYYRTSPIHLYIIAGSRLAFKIMKKLMDTWELEQGWLSTPY